MNPVHTMTAEPSTPVVRWSAVAAGSVVAAGLLIMLYALGLGAGLSAWDAQTPDQLKVLGLFGGTYGALVPLLALFVGGWVASRAAAARSRAAGLLQGLTVWGLTAIGLIWLLGSLVGLTASGTASLAGGLARASGAAASRLSEGVGDLGDSLSQVPGGELAQALRQRLIGDQDLGAEDLLRPINRTLTQHGRTQVQPQQLEAALKQLWQRALRDQKLERAQVLEVLAAKTPLEKGDAARLADALQEKFAAAQQQVAQASEAVQQKMAAAKEEATAKLTTAAQQVAAGLARGFWGLFLALVLGLVAALTGAWAAVAGDDD